MTELEFLGHLLSHRGIAPSPDKVSALKTMPFIQALEILCVRSWEWPRTLDSASFQTSHPYVSLWALLRQSTLSWDANSNEAFCKIREALSKPITLAYFDNQAPIVLAVDASPCGLGATISQNGKLVACASRKLSDAESRYSQIEREFLALVFGVHRFRSMLIGQKFIV